MPASSDTQKLLDSVAIDLGTASPGIDSRQDVCGGAPCIVRTRIPIWLLEEARRRGASDAVLLQSYPSLRPQDLLMAWSYVRTHAAEIDRQIREQEEETPG